MKSFTNKPNTILILGANGALGSAIYKVLSESNSNNVFGTIRGCDSQNLPQYFKKNQIIKNINAEDELKLRSIFNRISPTIVINCIAKIATPKNSKETKNLIHINSLLPHLLNEICDEISAKLIHISTDGVFSGAKGGYLESDAPDCLEIYGLSKLMGEITNSPNALTIRTSIIGHNRVRSHNLLDWFLNQSGTVMGHQSSIFSGITTLELAKIIRDFIIPNQNLCGIYNIGSKPIDKFRLLALISKIYNKNINLIPTNTITIDRSLNLNKFSHATGYHSCEWESQIAEMYEFYKLMQYHD